MKESIFQEDKEKYETTIMLETSTLHYKKWTDERSYRQIFSKDIVDLKNNINQLEVIDIFRLLHPKLQDVHPL